MNSGTIGLPDPWNDVSLESWVTTGRQFSLGMQLGNSYGWKPVGAGCSFSRFNSRNSISLSLAHGRDSVILHRYADVETAEGALAEVSLRVGDVIAGLEIGCNHMRNKGELPGLDVLTPWAQMQVYFRFSFRPTPLSERGMIELERRIVPYTYAADNSDWRRPNTVVSS